jgi:hypothetical protein
VRIFVDWSLVEHELLRDSELEAIATDVHRFVDHYDGRTVERSADAHDTFSLRVASARMVTLHWDAMTQTLTVLSVHLEPDPDSEPVDDPGEYEDEG